MPPPLTISLPWHWRTIESMDFMSYKKHVFIFLFFYHLGYKISTYFSIKTIHHRKQQKFYMISQLVIYRARRSWDSEPPTPYDPRVLSSSLPRDGILLLFVGVVVERIKFCVAALLTQSVESSVWSEEVTNVKFLPGPWSMSSATIVLACQKNVQM